MFSHFQRERGGRGEREREKDPNEDSLRENVAELNCKSALFIIYVKCVISWPGTNKTLQALLQFHFVEGEGKH